MGITPGCPNQPAEHPERLHPSHRRQEARELRCSCSDLLFALKPVSENLHFCSKCLSGEIQAGMCSSPDLTGGSKDKSGSTWLPSFCFSLSLPPAPHWYRMLPSRFTVRTANIKEQRRQRCFQMSRKLPGGGEDTWLLYWPSLTSAEG